MKVLIVEDDMIASRVLEAALMKLGHEVLVAGDGESAWELLKKEHLRVVISDWQMPALDGLGLCQRIRQGAGEYVYFILLTQMAASERNLHNVTYAGVDDFLEKPINPVHLWMRLRVAERILGFTTKVQKLESFIPICSYCKKVRDDQNYWEQIERYVAARTGSSFSHGVCPECVESVVKPELARMGVALPPLCEHTPALIPLHEIKP